MRFRAKKLLNFQKKKKFCRFHGATPGYSPVPLGPAAAATADAPAAADDAADAAGGRGASHSAAAAAGKKRPARGWFEESRSFAVIFTR